MAANYLCLRRLLLVSTAATLLIVLMMSLLLPKFSQEPAFRLPALEDKNNRVKYFNFLEALLVSGELTHWGDLLNKIRATDLPYSATMFIPRGRSGLPLEHVALNSTVYSYHVVPQRLPFSVLSLFPIGSRLPTLLPSNYILITNNSHSNFCIDGTLLTWPDLFTSEMVTVHGIEHLLNSSKFGGAGRNGQSTLLLAILIGGVMNINRPL